jgi:hypothetical protein
MATFGALPTYRTIAEPAKSVKNGPHILKWGFEEWTETLVRFTGKGAAPMRLNFEGMKMDDNEEQSRKAKSPISDRFESDSIAILESPWQDEKQCRPIFETDDGTAKSGSE